MSDQNAAALTEGDVAPDFDLPRDGGGAIGLSALKDKAVALYFYPKDDTSGCTAESIDFSRLKADFDNLPDGVKAAVIAIMDKGKA